MDRKVFFHKVCQMRTTQREYFKTRSKAVLERSKRLEKLIDDEITRAKAVMAAKARLFYELVNTGQQIDKEWLDSHVIASLDFFFCDAEFRQDIEEHFYDKGFCENYNFPTLVINDMGDYSDDDMLEFKYEYINHKYYVTFLDRLKG